MIRQAEAADTSAIIGLLRDSRVGAGFDSKDGLTGFVFPFDPAYAGRLFLAHLALRRLALVNAVDGVAKGVLLAAAFEHPFGPVWLAQETVWWIDPACRGTAAVRMLDAYEAWAAEQGCKFAGMAGMGEDPVVRKLYERRGYRAAELHFLKVL